MMHGTTLYLVIGAAVVLLLALIILLARGGKRVAEVSPVPAEEAPPPAPVAMPEAVGAPDPLTRIKGLGPRAATQLETLGITRYDQLAALTPEQAASVDAQMGALQGRLKRDRWVDQARLLATGDTDAFEAEFGKLG